jgi:hypothetical protein
MWKVVARRAVRPLIDDLKGERAGYAAAYEQLARDPCAIYPGGSDGDARPFAYRLSGPLERKVCGVHLRNGYRLAFTMTASDDPQYVGVVEVLYVGTRDTRDRSRDVWDIVHDLFEVQNPRAGHLRPPCCEGQLPDMEESEIQEFMDRLRRFVGRR